MASTHRAEKAGTVHVDRTKLSREELDRIGAPKPLPKAKPGQTMHQVGRLGPGRSLLKRELWPIYPMFGMVALGLSLAAMTSYRMLVTCPEVIVSKEVRNKGNPYIEDGEKLAQDGKVYSEKSPLRTVSGGGRGIRSIFFSDTPRLR
eukprot:TRINITY_DN7864_c0_g1_i1.p1 TRINITY_DN7864_c0_g1~~TRINITY_DN7864_c0_g1_i1.p1  ORF type:complete len:147 (-),score=24.25 TRINITY_DN7864_c0_g1_i1:470-910(-)